MIILNQEYTNTLIRYKQTKEEFALIQEQNISNGTLIKAKEREIENLRQLLSQFQPDKLPPEDWHLEENVLNSVLVQKLHKYSSKGMHASDEDLMEAVALVNNHYPEFFPKLSDTAGPVSVGNRYICALIKLRFLPSEIASLLDMTSQSVTNRRARLCRKIFGPDCPTADFDFRIREL